MEDVHILNQAAELANEAKSVREFTDVKNFTLLCGDCNIQLTGNESAQKHAKDTGHVNFREL